VILFVKNNLEVDGRGLSPYPQAPAYDPTQRLRGKPITLNTKLYNNIIIYLSIFERLVHLLNFYVVERFYCVKDFNAKPSLTLK
jgi:hypothetical protein